MQGRLGKLAPKPDRRTLQLHKYVPSELPIPAAVDWSAEHEDFYWGQLGNDVFGNCTCAAACHQTDLWRIANKKPAISVTDDAIEAYSAVTGFKIGFPSTDRGAYMLDVLKYWRSTGIVDHKIEAFVQCTVDMIPHAVAVFGGAYIGLNLPLSAQDQETWDVVVDGGSASSPGSWGGHTVNVISYDPMGVNVVTWGKRKRLTWAFLRTYCDEAYAVLSEVWAPNASPGGLNIDGLRADIAAL